MSAHVHMVDQNLLKRISDFIVSDEMPEGNLALVKLFLDIRNRLTALSAHDNDASVRAHEFRRLVATGITAIFPEAWKTWRHNAQEVIEFFNKQEKEQDNDKR